MRLPINLFNIVTILTFGLSTCRKNVERAIGPAVLLLYFLLPTQWYRSVVRPDFFGWVKRNSFGMVIGFLTTSFNLDRAFRMLTGPGFALIWCFFISWSSRVSRSFWLKTVVCLGFCLHLNAGETGWVGLIGVCLNFNKTPGFKSLRLVVWKRCGTAFWNLRTASAVLTNFFKPTVLQHASPVILTYEHCWKLQRR